MPRIKRYKFEFLADRAHNDWAFDRPDVMAVDTETHGVMYHDEAFAATVAWRTSSGVQSHYFELERAEGLVKHQLREMLEETPRLIFHNAKFDLQKLLLAGLLQRDRLSSERIEDTEALAHLLDEHQDKKLKPLARKFLGVSTDETEELKKARRKGKFKVEDGYGVLPREVVVPYAIKDAEFTLRLWELFYPQLRKHDDLMVLYAKEMQLTLVLLDMEAAGMAVDLDYVEDTTKEYAGKILEAEWRIGDTTGLKVWYPEKSGQKTPEGCLNPNAWQQTLPIIQARGIKVKSTGDEALKPFRDDEFVGALLELRRLKKIYGTYLLAIARETRDGIIHPNFRQHGAKTGRMSSGGAEDG